MSKLTKPLLRSGAHTKYRVMYHIVWIPKYRKRVLKGQLAKRLEELLRECCEVNGWKVEELNVQEDHVHLLIEFQITTNVPKAVQILKGGTSKRIREEFPDLKEFLWGSNLWSEGYFAETIGRVNEHRVKEYIKNQ